MSIWQGERVRLRAVEMDDLDDYFYNNGYEDTDSARSGDRIYFPRSYEKLKEQVETMARSNNQGEEYFLIIEDKNGRPIGNINTHSLARIDGFFKYGIGIRKQYRGRGYASEAIKLLLRYFFDELNYQKVNVDIVDFNSASIRLHEKFGFILEGRIRRAHYTGGQWHDSLCYGMTKEEYYLKHGNYTPLKG